MPHRNFLTFHEIVIRIVNAQKYNKDSVGNFILFFYFVFWPLQFPTWISLNQDVGSYLICIFIITKSYLIFPFFTTIRSNLLKLNQTSLAFYFLKQGIHSKSQNQPLFHLDSNLKNYSLKNFALIYKKFKWISIALWAVHHFLYTLFICVFLLSRALVEHFLFMIWFDPDSLYASCPQ
jgi:hypothetical protein